MRGVRRHVKYSDGLDMRVGDLVAIGSNAKGIVVACIDTGEYSVEHPREQWGYLGIGVMIDTSFGGLVHYPDQAGVFSEDITLIARKSV